MAVMECEPPPKLKSSTVSIVEADLLGRTFANVLGNLRFSVTKVSRISAVIHMMAVILTRPLLRTHKVITMCTMRGGASHAEVMEAGAAPW